MKIRPLMVATNTLKYSEQENIRTDIVTSKKMYGKIS